MLCRKISAINWFVLELFLISTGNDRAELVPLKLKATWSILCRGILRIRPYFKHEIDTETFLPILHSLT
jgi:hypothetical protein